MDQHTGKRIGAALALAGMGALAGCAGTGTGTGTASSQPLLYRCDNGMQFKVRFAEDTALIRDEARGGQEEVLLRDAGGQGPQQAVFSSARLRAEFGVGVGAREAVLHYFQPPVAVRCARD